MLDHLEKREREGGKNYSISDYNLHLHMYRVHVCTIQEIHQKHFFNEVNTKTVVVMLVIITIMATIL